MDPLNPTNRLYPVEKDFISDDDLYETECLLRNLVNSSSKTNSLSRTWVEQREKSIEAIGRLEKKLENLHWACNVASGVGGAMQAAGGLTFLAGVFFTACGHTTAGEFLANKASTATAGTGVAISVSSAVAEMALTQKTMEEVKKVLEKDEEYTKILVENLQHSRKIDSHLKRIFNCSILSSNFLAVVRFVQEGISLLDIGYEVYSEWIDDMIRMKSKGADISELIETVIQNACSTMKKLFNDKKVRDAVSNICDIIQQQPSAFEFMKLGVRISFQICDVPKVDIITSILGFFRLKTSAGVVATKCLLETVLIALNVLSVISAIKNLKEGTSKYAKMLKELNLALSMELNTVNYSYLHPKLL